jgi:hypothetical protein
MIMVSCGGDNHNDDDGDDDDDDRVRERIHSSSLRCYLTQFILILTSKPH